MIASPYSAPRYWGWTLVLLLALISMPCVAWADHELRIVRANSTTVDIQDGNRFKKDIWTIQPSLKLDVYEADRSSKKKRVTFRTDIDAISFDVEPGKEYDFIILLKNKYRCTTRISLLRSGYQRTEKRQATAFDEIPFTLGRDDKIHIQGRINGSEPLDLLFDTGADAVVLYPSAFMKKAQVDQDGTTENSGFGGVTTRKTSSDNSLDIAGLHWDHEDILLIEKQADAADGVVGFHVFEDKVMEIDYKRMVLRLRESLPKNRSGYKKVDTRNVGALMAIKAVLNTGKKSVIDWVIVDTGANGTLHLSHAFAQSNQLFGTMTKISTSRSGGVGAKVIENDRVLLPELEIGGMRLTNLPIDMSTEAEGFAAENTFGMRVLRHYNMILDYPNRQIYMRPSSIAPATL